MKQHKASRKNGSTRSASRSGAPRKATARKAPRPKAAARASGASKAVAHSSARAPKAAAGKRAPAAPSGLVKLPSECLIGSIDDLRAQLIERVTSETPVSLDASSVERIDTAALQLLAAFTRDRAAAGHPIEWKAVSTSMSDAAALLNLTAVLALDGVDATTHKVAA